MRKSIEHVLFYSVNAKRHGQPRLFVPPVPQIKDFYQPVLCISYLTFVNYQTRIYLASLHCG